MKASRSTKHLGIGLLGGALLLGPALARAEGTDDVNKNAARQFATEGVQKYEQGDFQAAWDLFHRANELVGAPTLAVWEARALEKLGRLVAAEERYVQALRAKLDPNAPAAFAQAMADADRELKQLRPRIPSLKIVVSGPAAGADGLSVKRNGEAVEPALLGAIHRVDPGEYEIVATAPNMKSARASVRLAEAASEVVTLEPEPLPMSTANAELAPAVDTAADESSPAETIGWAGIGVGAAGIGVGVITGVMATAERSEAEKGCPNGTCVEGTAGADALETFRTLRTVSTIGYIVGAVGAGAGAYLLFAAPGSSKQNGTSVRPWLGIGAAGVRGAF